MPAYQLPRVTASQGLPWNPHRCWKLGASSKPPTDTLSPETDEVAWHRGKVRLCVCMSQEGKCTLIANHTFTMLLRYLLTVEWFIYSSKIWCRSLDRKCTLVANHILTKLLSIITYRMGSRKVPMSVGHRMRSAHLLPTTSFLTIYHLYMTLNLLQYLKEVHFGILIILYPNGTLL